MILNYQFQFVLLYFSGTVDHIIKILIMISTGVFRYFYFFKSNIGNIQIICFLLAHFNSFFNNYFFFKFVNKCQKDILRSAPPSSHVWFFIKLDKQFSSHFINFRGLILWDVVLWILNLYRIVGVSICYVHSENLLMSCGNYIMYFWRFHMYR